MSLIVNPAYNQLSEAIGPFYATLKIAQDAREITKSLDNRITTASAIDYAARGMTPDPKDYPDHKLDRVKNYIDYVLDVEIKAAVIKSYESSLANYNLVYDYNTVMDGPRQARIRILMNILWDNRPHKKG